MLFSMTIGMGLASLILSHKERDVVMFILWIVIIVMMFINIHLASRNAERYGE